MMDKLWYILKGGDQFGPFDEADLQEMFKNRKISHETTLLRRGYSQPILVKDLIKKPQPQAAQPMVEKVEPRVIMESFKKATPPPAPKVEKVTPKEITTKRSFTKPLLALTSLFVFFALIYNGSKSVIVNQSFNLERPKDVRAKKFSRHKRMMQKAFENNNHKWSFVLSKDLKSLYLLSSLPGKQNVKLKFTSLPNKILSSQPVEFYSKVDLNNNLAEVKEFNFTKGTQIIPGSYQVELELIKNTMSPLQKFFLDEFKLKESFTDQIILKFHSKNTFKSELAKFQKLEKRRNNAFVQDIKMKYETLLTIANRISNNLNEAKKGPLSKDQVEFRKNYFLQDYQMKYGTFFSNFVIENEKKFKDLTNSTDELKTGIIAHYSTLSSIARSLGMVSIDAIDSFANLPKDRDVFQPVLKRYQSIITTCKNKIDKLENIDLKQ